MIDIPAPVTQITNILKTLTYYVTYFVAGTGEQSEGFEYVNVPRPMSPQTPCETCTTLRTCGSLQWFDSTVTNWYQTLDSERSRSVGICEGSKSVARSSLASPGEHTGPYLIPLKAIRGRGVDYTLLLVRAIPTDNKHPHHNTTSCSTNVEC